MDLGMAKRRALVMGGSSGLGKGIAQALIAEGARVAICARGAERLAATAAQIGAEGIVTDLSKPGAAGALVVEAERRLGPLDILIVNTGGPPPGKFLDIGDDTWRSAFEALWMSSVGAMRPALTGMRAPPLGPGGSGHLNCGPRTGRQPVPVQFAAGRAPRARQCPEQGSGAAR